MGIFDRKIEKKSTKKMTREQKIRQNYAIINYYKKKNNENISSNSKNEIPNKKDNK